MIKGKHNSYTVFEWVDEKRSFRLKELLTVCPWLVEGMYVVISSRDSGHYRLTPQDISNGWHLHGLLAHSPRVTDWRSLPFEMYDEWHVFDKQVTIPELEPFVSWGGFSPLTFGWEEKRDCFWNQIDQHKPMHVIGDGSNLWLVTRDSRTIDMIRDDSCQ